MLLALAFSGSASGAWFDPNYLYKKQIVIDHRRVAGNLTNFPFLLSMTDAELRAVASGGRVQNANGFDLVFTDSAETIKLDHELESYDATTGRAVIWVRIPALSSTTDTVLYFYFGNASVSSSQENPNGVWSAAGYRGVWHLGENSGNALDSTSYGSSGTAPASVTRGVPGRIGNAFSFSGAAGSNVLVGDPADDHLDFGTSSFSFQAWVFVTGPTGDWQSFVAKGGDNVTGYQFESPPTVDGLNASIQGGSTNINTGHVNSTGTWTHFVVTVDRSTNQARHYWNGIPGTPVDISTMGSTSNTFSLRVGSDSNGAFGSNARIDEVRVTSSALSAQWITTEYDNQLSPETGIEVVAAPDGGSLQVTDAPPPSDGAQLVEPLRLSVGCTTAAGGATGLIGLTALFWLTRARRIRRFRTTS
ncbi:MAG: DUF2341 domain-containing protein [Myxococcaceae bacterium]